MVYRARDLRLGRTVAVKVILDGLSGDPDFVKRFDREARSAAILSHPNIVAVFDQGHEGERAYIVMEYIRGQSLRQIISSSAPLPPAVALNYMDAIAKALAAAHEAGIIHRDIKPENVLVTNDGQVKVTDFGLAKNLTSHSSVASAGMLMGTISYIPPEATQSGTSATSSDVYSAGIVLYEMLTGLKPHRGTEASEIIYKHIHVDIPPPSEALTGDAQARIPDYLDALTQACTSRVPQRRPANGKALEDAVSKVRAALDKGVESDPDLAAELLGNHPEPTPVTTGNALTVVLPNPEIHEATPQRGPRVTPLARIAPSPAGPGPAKQRKAIVPLVLLGAIVLVVGVVGWWVLSGQWTTTPDLIGQSQAYAQTVVGPAGLKVEFLNEYSETMPKDAIIRTDPGSGERIKKGGRIQAWISLGPERYAMPTVVDKPLEEAKTAIQTAHLKVGDITEVWSETVAEGVVVSASQAPGAELKKDTPVDLEVSKGREPITIESYEGSTVGEATDALTAAGFVVDSTARENSPTVPKDSVISQSPKEGTGYRGDTVTLVISDGPRMVQIPSVLFMTQSEATSALAAVGLQVKAENANSMGGPTLNMASGTNPPAGRMVPEGSLVILYIV
jgi:serine/threonine-protein kinase